jgi:hypothetical protein
MRLPTVIEIPIEFRDRQHGQSKLSLREQANYVRHVARACDAYQETSFGCPKTSRLNR